MIAVIDFVFFVFGALLQLLSLTLLIWAVMSWLVAFDVLSMRNRLVSGVYGFLDGVARPVLYPIQRMIPSLGGVDISPIIALLIIQGMQRFLLPAAYSAAIALAAGA